MGKDWQLWREVFDHPCTGPDFSSSDYQLFSKLKEFLAGVGLDRDEELVHNQQVVKKQNTTANFYDKGIKKLVSCYEVRSSYENYVKSI